MSATSNIATVSFKLTPSAKLRASPAHYTILQALVVAEGKTAGCFVRCRRTRRE